VYKSEEPKKENTESDMQNCFGFDEDEEEEEETRGKETITLLDQID
jgi:hypothetical protein